MITSTRNNLLTIHREQMRVERRGVWVARRVVSRIRTAVLRHYRQRRQISPEMIPAFLRNVAPILTESMIAAHVTGFQRAKKEADQHISLALIEELPARYGSPGPFSATENLLGKLTGPAAETLRRRYEYAALQVTSDVSEELDLRLRATVADLIARGAHVKEAVRVLQDEFSTLGLSPQKPYRLEAIFRTQSQIAYNAGRWQADQNLGVQSILWGYRYVTAHDDRVRPSHAVLDGVTLEKDDPFWSKFWPPNGWNCRCITIPLFEESPIQRPPWDAQPDPGFGFNPGQVFL